MKKTRSKSETIRSLIDKGLKKPQIVAKTGYSQQLVHIVYTKYKSRKKPVKRTIKIAPKDRLQKDRLQEVSDLIDRLKRDILVLL